MKVHVKNINKTNLNSFAYEKLIKKYAKLKYDLFVSFDYRIKDMGIYIFDSIKRKHLIKINPKKHDKDKNLDEVLSTELISTTLHEIKHALQKEEHGTEFWSDSFSSLKELKENLEKSEFYSQCETEARTFENENILNALEIYKKNLPK